MIRPPAAFWKGVAGGFVGLLIAALLIHAWVDHQALHALSDYVTQHAGAINSLTTPPPGASH